MKSQVICGALNTVNPTPAQRARMRAALEAQLPAEKPHRRGAHQQKASSQRWWTIIPAAAALFAVVLLGIFVLGRTDKTPPSMSNVPTEPLTLESLQSSANYKASMEIKDYVQSYNATGDVDETLSESYRAYGCRTKEMAAKVDEICGEYGLSKVGASQSADTAEKMFSALGLKSMIRTGNGMESTTSNASFDTHGNFEFWGSTYFTGVGPAPIEYRVYRAMKDDLSTAYWEIGDVNDWTWESYTTTAGTPVLLASGQDNSLILCDTGDSLVIVVGMNATAGEMFTSGITMQAFADCFDFSLTSGDEEKKTLDEAADLAVYQPILAKYISANSEGWTAVQCMINDISPAVVTADKYGYTLIDLNGDGRGELVITTGSAILDLFGIYSGDNLASHILSENEQHSFLCKDNVILSTKTGTNGDIIDTIFRLTEDYHFAVETVLINQAEGGWLAGSSEADAQPISDSQASEIMTAYPTEIVTYTAFPARQQKTADEMPEAYQLVINKDITAITEGWGWAEGENTGICPMISNVSSLSDLGYALMDLDGDGTEELIIADNGQRQVIYDLYSLVNGQLVHILSGGERNSYELRENSVILNVGSNGAASTDYVFYRVSGGQLVQDTLIRFDAMADENHPWSRGTNEQNLEHITDDSWSEENIYGMYAGVTIPIKTFAEISSKSDDPALAAYKGYISSADLSWIRYYSLRDLDGDGQQELLLFNTGKTLEKVAGISNGTVQEILSGNTLYLCSGDVLEEWGGGSGGQTMTYYRVENGKAVPIDCITYRIHNDQWYRDSDYDFYTEDLTPITEEEQQRVADAYARVDVGLKSLETVSL